MEKVSEHGLCIPTEVDIEGEIFNGVIVNLLDDEGNDVKHPFRATQGVVYMLEGDHKGYYVVIEVNPDSYERIVYN